MNNNLKSIQKLALNCKKPPLSLLKYRNEIKNVRLYKFDKIKKPLLSFVIIAHNEEDDLLRLLNSIVCSNEKSYEIILVDNGLSLNVKEKLKSYPLKHITLNNNFGCSTGRNIGSLHANADILFFVDADGYLDCVDAVIDKAVQMNKNKSVIAIRGKIVDLSHNWFKRKPVHYDLGSELVPSFPDTEGVTLFKKVDFIKAGGFEDGLFGFEGIVLCYRMVEFYNYDIDSFIYDPEIILIHNYSSGIFDYISKKKRYRYINNKVKIRYPFIRYFNKYFSRYRKSLSPDRSIFSIIQNILDSYLKFKVDKYYFSNNNHNEDIQSSGFKNAPDFTVVIICPKNGNYFQRAVDSVLNQTFKNLQLLIIGDIPDNPETVRKLNEISNKAYIVKPWNTPFCPSTFFEAIAEVKSKYFFILDGFKCLLPTYLEKTMNIFENYEDVGIVSCFNDKNTENLFNYNSRFEKKVDNEYLINHINTASSFRKDAVINTFKDTGEFTYENLKENCLKIINKGWKIEVIPEYLIEPQPQS